MKMSSILAATLFLAALLPTANAVCSNATVAGSYGFTTNGVLFAPGPVPVAAAGLITFDLKGDVDGNQNRSVGGAFLHETFQGTYTISNDCALQFTVNVYDDAGTLLRTSVVDGVVVDNGKQVKAMFESITLPNGAMLGSALTADAVRVQGHEK